VRCVLFTGKGGVGKTTVAAASATLAAGRGHRTLVVSTDSAHSLSDALDHPLGPRPVEVDTRLSGQQIDTQQAFEGSWKQVRHDLVALLDATGVDPIEAEELTVLPGADEVLALLAVHEQVHSGDYDLVVVDCPSTAQTLRLLAFPEALTWYLRRVFPGRRRVARTLRPRLGQAARGGTAQDALYQAVDRLHTALSGVRAVLTDPTITSVRLVLTPEAVVVAEARRMLTSLSLLGYRADAVIANRVFPAAGADAWRAGWVAAQRDQLAEVDASFNALPVLRSAYRAGEPVGLEELAAFGAAAYGDLDPAALLGTGAVDPLHVETTAHGFELSLGLPFAERSEVELVRRGDELVVTIGAQRRLLALPSALRRCDVTGAAMHGGRLVVSFTPDREQWARA
jgi:arsenite/tail-anchored protein-transporting ATPase